MLDMMMQNVSSVNTIEKPDLIDAQKKIELVEKRIDKQKYTC